MTVVGWLQILVIFATVVAFAMPLGAFLSKVFSGERNLLTPVLGPVERGFHRLAGVDPAKEQGWLGYTLGMLAFNAAGFLLLYLLLRFQGVLPLNPQGFAGLTPDLAFNTAVSFVTNTNWQSYGGETTMSHLSQIGVGELTARLRAGLRHARQTLSPGGVLRSGPIEIDVEAHQVRKAGVEIRLTRREFDVLVVLLREAGKVVTHSRLLREVWGSANEGDTQYLRVYVGQLRQKLEDDPSTPRLIVTEPGIGYRLMT